MTNNIQPQLPAELDAEILWDQHSALIGDDLDDLSYWSGRDVMKKEDFLKAITEYATKLHQVETEIEDKANEIERLRRIVSKHKSGRTYQEQKSKIENMRTLLEKFISRHEAGLLPDRFIYNDIKSFLDGQK